MGQPGFNGAILKNDSSLAEIEAGLNLPTKRQEAMSPSCMEISPLNLNPVVTETMEKVVKSADSEGNEEDSKDS